MADTSLLFIAAAQHAVRSGNNEVVVDNRYTDRIIVRSLNLQFPPFWERLGELAHGKTSPIAALVIAIDGDGIIYALGDYYQPGLTPENLR